MSALDLLPTGQVVDRYQVVDLLGQGGMAVVYRVRHESLGSLHALKVVAVPSRSVLQRLLQEGRSQARVRHRNIVSVHDAIEVDGSPGLVMEYVAGPSLDLLIRSVALPLSTIDALAIGLMRGVAAAHEAGLVHRDLKPANVLVSVESDGLIPKVADFGLAKDFVSGEGQTRTGAFMGTPNYMAPEQIRDARSVDVRSDVFSLGAILYELLTGRRAFEGGDVLDVFTRIAEGRYAPVESLRPDAPPRMVEAVRRALQVDRAARPDDVEALLAIWSGGPAVAAPSLDALDPGVLAEVRRLVSLPPPSSTRGSAPSPQAGETLALSLDGAEVDATPPPPPRRRVGRSAVLVTGLSLAGLSMSAMLALLVALRTLPTAVFDGLEPQTSPPPLPGSAKTEPSEVPPPPEREEEPAPQGTEKKDARSAPKPLSRPSRAEPAAPSPAPVSAPTPAPSLRDAPTAVAPPPPLEPAAGRRQSAPTGSVGVAEGAVPDEDAALAEPEPVAEGIVRVEGALVELRSGDTAWAPGRLPAGRYRLLATFGPTEGPVEVGLLDVAAGQEWSIRCSPLTRLCVSELR